MKPGDTANTGPPCVPPLSPSTNAAQLCTSNSLSILAFVAASLHGIPPQLSWHQHLALHSSSRRTHTLRLRASARCATGACQFRSSAHNHMSAQVPLACVRSSMSRSCVRRSRVLVMLSRRARSPPSIGIRLATQKESASGFPGPGLSPARCSSSSTRMPRRPRATSLRRARVYIGFFPR